MIVIIFAKIFPLFWAIYTKGKLIKAAKKNDIIKKAICVTIMLKNSLIFEKMFLRDLSSSLTNKVKNKITNI